MYRKLALSLCVTLLTAAVAMAQEPADEPKELSGMSIVGNDDAPKSLYIVPWKSSEIGLEASLTRMLDEDGAPVDRDVFRRELDFYQVSAANRTPPVQAGGIAQSGTPEKQSTQQFFSIAPKF